MPCSICKTVGHTKQMCPTTLSSSDTAQNPHSLYINKRISDIRRKSRWETTIVNTTHTVFIRDFTDNVFTNLIHQTFTRTYMSRHPCADCGAPSTDRCHGIGEERPVLIARALARVWPDITVPITLKEIVIAFLEEHKTTKFALKCKACHAKETLKPTDASPK
jgi:hypothetical protein